jgi:16S rRNA A1518/A1519 N6-dimethyltransferase RsmA/KsgA/DIM1 with predicted DNA glycosylase/AP lyase activity
MLRGSLKSLPKALVALDELGIPSTARAEELSVADFCRLSARLAS